MAIRLRFPTLFDTLPTTPMLYPALAAAPAPWRSRRGLVAVAGLAFAAAGCEPPRPHALLDAETETVRQSEPNVRADTAAPAVPPAHDSVTPGSGAIRIPSVLQGYGV